MTTLEAEKEDMMTETETSKALGKTSPHHYPTGDVMRARSEIAMRLMAGMVSNQSYDCMQNHEIAECAVRCADLLLAAPAAPKETK